MFTLTGYIPAIEIVLFHQVLKLLLLWELHMLQQRKSTVKEHDECVTRSQFSIFQLADLPRSG